MPAENVQGEQQMKLDLFANEKLKAALKARGVVAGLLPKKKMSLSSLKVRRTVRSINGPLDGSSNIDVNVSVGTIFSIYHRISEPAHQSLKPISCSRATSRLPQVTWCTVPQP